MYRHTFTTYLCELVVRHGCLLWCCLLQSFTTRRPCGAAIEICGGFRLEWSLNSEPIGKARGARRLKHVVRFGIVGGWTAANQRQKHKEISLRTVVRVTRTRGGDHCIHRLGNISSTFLMPSLHSSNIELLPHVYQMICVTALEKIRAGSLPYC